VEDGATTADAGRATALRGGLANVGLRISTLRDYGIVASFVALFVALTFSSDVFLSQANLLNVLDQSAVIGLMAVGGTLVFIAGGFDLSVGAIYAMSGVVAGLSAPHIGPELALLLGPLTGLGLGILNGMLVTVGRINPFIATLSSAIVIRGVALLMTGGYIVLVSDPAFTALGRGEVLDVKYSVLIWLGFALVCGFILAFTTFGRYIYASGGNPEAARLSGVRVGVVRAATFAISGLSAGIAGVIVASRVASGQADAGMGIEFAAIAAIVVGGTSILGGEGAIWRTMLGVLLLALIGNGFNLLNVDAVYQQIFHGTIILLAVGIDAWARKVRR
jgi:ribose transport system permease protein